MKLENKENCVRTHRVGSLTAGLGMILFGVLFMLHLLIDTISYTVIFSLWPMVLIGLGIEIFLSNFSERKLVYDKGAVFLLIFMALFAMLMAFVDVCMKAGIAHFNL